MAGPAAAQEWYWKAKRGWELFDAEDAVRLEQSYRTHKNEGRKVKQAAAGRKSLDVSAADKEIRYPLNDDNTVSFAEMKQYRTYGDPSWFRAIHRGVPAELPKTQQKAAAAAPADGAKASGGKPRPPGSKKMSRKGSGRSLADRRAADGWGSAAGAADAWVKEGAVRKNEAARRAKSEVRQGQGGTFSLRTLPCQDTDYETVKTDMVHWFKLADEDPGAAEAQKASRKPNTPESIRHLKRSLKQARVYKDTQNASSVNLNAAAAEEAAGFDMVNCFSLPGGGYAPEGYGQDDGSARASRPVALTGTGQVLEGEWGDFPPPPSHAPMPQSQSARGLGGAGSREPAEEYGKPQPWSARDFGTNWSQTKKPRPPPQTHGRQHLDAVRSTQQAGKQQSVRPERSWASSSEASGWAAVVLGPSAADAGTARAGTSIGTFPPIAQPVGVAGEVVMSHRPRIVYKFSPRFGTFGQA